MVRTFQKNIAMVGFNNDTISKLVEPNLSTIDYPGRVVGEKAASCLVDHLRKISGLNSIDTVVSNAELAVRELSIKLRN